MTRKGVSTRHSKGDLGVVGKIEPGHTDANLWRIRVNPRGEEETETWDRLGIRGGPASESSEDPIASEHDRQTTKPGRRMTRQPSLSPRLVLERVDPSLDDDELHNNHEEEAELELPPLPGALKARVSAPRDISKNYPPSSDGPPSSSATNRQSDLPRFPLLGQTSIRSSAGQSQRSSYPLSLRSDDYATPPSSTDTENIVGSNRQNGHGQKRRRGSPDGSPSTDHECQDYGSLFDGSKRRQKTSSSEGHIEMIKACKGLIVARVMSGDGTIGQRSGRRCDAWANTNTEFEGQLVQLVWDEVRNKRRQFRIGATLHVARGPYPWEARLVRAENIEHLDAFANGDDEIRDSIGDYRSKFMQKARDQVRHDVAANMETDKLCDKVEFLLDQDRFMCGTGAKGGEEIDVTDRWTSQWIVTLIERVFWMKAESGLARHSGLKAFFEPLRSETIYYAVTCLYWSIKEYSTGLRVKANCDTDFENAYDRFKTLWNQQRRLKQQIICQIMTERVKIVVSRTNGQLRPDIDTEDPHRDDLSALDAYRLFMPQDLQERLAVEMARTGMDGGGGIDGQPVTGSTTPKTSCGVRTKRTVNMTAPGRGRQFTGSGEGCTLIWHGAEDTRTLELGWDTSFDTVVDILMKESPDKMVEGSPWLWFYVHQNDGGTGKETIVTDNEQWERFLSDMRQSEHTRFHGREWVQEDEVSE